MTVVHLQDEENLTKDQIEAEIKKIKEANADDEGMRFYYLEWVYLVMLKCHYLSMIYEGA